MEIIQFDPKLKIIFPELRLGVLSAEVKVNPTNKELEEFKNSVLQEIQNSYTIEEIQKNLIIEQTRVAYKNLGKEPSRYRPSAESLLRRVLNGKGLYSINNVVDLINAVSVQSGFSIGGYDYESINGNITVDVGKQETYEAIGRGLLNIENLPVLRDQISAFGSPTSDSERTKISMKTKKCLWIFFDFYSNKLIDQSLELSSSFLIKFADATNIHVNKVNVH